MTRGMCVCGHTWSNHRKIEGCLGEPTRPYKFEKLCECPRFRKKVEEQNVEESITSRQTGETRGFEHRR